MNLALQLTVLRIVLVPVGLLVLLMSGMPFRFLIAFVIFVLAAITDYADGKIARSRGQTTKLGSFLDPLADKLLVLTFFVFLTSLGTYPVWLLLLMIMRELVHDGFRNFLASAGNVVGANMWSKWKAALQMVSLALVLLALALIVDLERSPEVAQWLVAGANLVMIVALVCGLIGTLIFFRRHVSALR